MSKKDYVAITKIVKSQFAEWGIDNNPDYVDGYRDSAKCIARRIADYMESDNTRFNRAKFLSACGIEE